MRTVVLSIFALVSTGALAAEGNLEALMSVESVKEGTAVDTDAAAITYIGPGVVKGFFYFGVGGDVTEWWWAAVSTGAVYNWTGEQGMDLLISSKHLWTIGEGRVTIFAQADGYLLSHAQDYYGWYALDYHKGDWSYGLQAEQVNLGVIAGPHLSLAFSDHFAASAQHYWDFGEVHWARMAFIISL